MYGNNSGGFRPRRSFAPVKVGEEFDVTIEAVGEKGDGVAKIKGFVLFVPNVQEGQRVKVRINKVLRRVGFAEVVGEATTGAQEAPAEDTEEFGEEPAAEKPEETPAEEVESETTEEEPKEE